MVWKIVKYGLLIVVALVALLLAVAEYEGQQTATRNRPLWTSSAEGGFKIDDSLALNGAGPDLLLERVGGQKAQRLFSNYRDAFRSLAMYRKDLDQDGEAELIFVAEDEGAGDIYIFSNLQRQEVSRSVNPDLIWTANKLMFSDANAMFIRSCGSQYCEDAFYAWRDGKLVEAGIDSFESW